MNKKTIVKRIEADNYVLELWENEKLIQNKQTTIQLLVGAQINWLANGKQQEEKTTNENKIHSSSKKQIRRDRNSRADSRQFRLGGITG